MNTHDHTKATPGSCCGLALSLLARLSSQMLPARGTKPVMTVAAWVAMAFVLLNSVVFGSLPSGDALTCHQQNNRFMGLFTLDRLSGSFAYDKMGNLTNHTDTAGRDTRFTYLPTRKLSSVTRGSGAETATVTFEYDQQFNSLTIKDALDREVETYTLDIQDRPVTIGNVESQTMSVVYGVGDMVKSVTRFDGTTVSNSYDSAARLTGVSWPDASTTFTYYDNVLLRTVANEAGTVSNTFDNANRLTSVSLALHSLGDGGSVVDYSLDGIGNATNVLVSVEGSAILTNAYTFDAAERVSAIDGVGGMFAFDYGQYNGLVAEVSNSTSGVRAEYAFDDLDRLTNIVWRNSTNGVLRSFGYQYNSAGMITNVARETSSESVTYGYDSLDRLASASASYLTASYGWDLAGNPSSRTENGTNTSYTLGTGNKLMSWTGGSYGHDSAGCVTNIMRGSDTLSLSWDDRYNLASVATNGTVAEEYAYGPLGRRIMTVVNGVTNHHVYQGVHCVADLDADGDLVRSFQQGPGVDNWLSMTVHTGATPVVYYYLTDHLGTVHAVADENGDVVESYRYDPHGKVLGVWDGGGTPLAESAISNRILWQGREYSWATGLYYFRSRFYDPQTSRWLSRDKIGISGGVNLYQAFGCNGVNRWDPFGLCEDSPKLSDYWNNYKDFASASFGIALGASVVSGTVVGGPIEPTEPFAQAGIWGTELGALIVGGVTIVAYPVVRDATSDLISWMSGPWQHRPSPGIERMLRDVSEDQWGNITGNPNLRDPFDPNKGNRFTRWLRRIGNAAFRALQWGGGGPPPSAAGG